MVTSDQRKNPSCRNALIDERHKFSRGIFDWNKIDGDILLGLSRFGGHVTKWQGMRLGSQYVTLFGNFFRLRQLTFQADLGFEKILDQIGDCHFLVVTKWFAP